MTDCARSHTVLLVEDDVLVREAAINVLENGGFHVQCAYNGAEALDALADGLEPCLILLDWMMPVMNGAQTLAALQHDRDLAAIPLVVVSAFPPDHLDGVRVVRKPLRMRELVALVGEYCDVTAS